MLLPQQQQVAPISGLLKRVVKPKKGSGASRGQLHKHSGSSSARDPPQQVDSASEGDNATTCHDECGVKKHGSARDPPQQADSDSESEEIEQQACLLDPCVEAAAEFGACTHSQGCAKQQQQQQLRKHATCPSARPAVAEPFSQTGTGGTALPPCVSRTCKQLPSVSSPKRMSPSFSAASQHHAAQQALQPDHACQLLSRTWTTSSNDSSSMANVSQPASSRGCSGMQSLSSEGSSSKGMSMPCRGYMGTLASSGNASKLSQHQSLDSSDSNNAECKHHYAEVPEPLRSSDYPPQPKRMSFEFHYVPSKTNHAPTKGRNLTMGDLRGSIAEHVRKGVQPMAHKDSGVEEGVSPASLEQHLLGVLGMQSGCQQGAPPPKPRASFSGDNNVRSVLSPLAGTEVPPASRLSSSSGSFAFSGRPSFYGGSRREGNHSFEGSFPCTDRPSYYGGSRRQGNNSFESCPGGRPSGEHRLGSLDFGPLALALQNGIPLHSVGRARMRREQRQQQQHPYHHHPHRFSSQTSFNQLREPVSAVLQIMARSSSEQHLTQERTVQKFGRLLPRAPPCTPGSSPGGAVLM